MNSSNPIFSHQFQIVKELSAEFEKITVITGEAPIDELPANIQVFVSKWIPGKNLRNSFSFISRFLKIILADRNLIIFSHMTEVQSSLTSPISKVLRIRHYLWYAHVSKSKYLRWNYYWVDGIITSTTGSCPIHGEKVQVIGQSIDKKIFMRQNHKSSNLKKLIHIGRFDSSKNIADLIRVVKNLRDEGRDLTLHIIGSASNSDNLEYQRKVIQENFDNVTAGWITFSPNILRKNIPETLINYDIFIHAFQGSLDKTVVEATFLCLPVVTLNKEFINEFGSWSIGSAGKSLQDELVALLKSSPSLIESTMESRLKIAVEMHSLDRWIQKIVSVFNSKN
jgi:glycosyltransferase involved in cell wall biosynthesis